MANPILPLWECIPDGEPRAFGNRVYLYGSHDRFGCDKFCDYKLKAWSASVDDLNTWVCHGHIFQTRPDTDHESSVPHTDHELYAPDVVEKDGKYYLYTYIAGAKGCVSVSDRPEGPFQFLSTYEYAPEDAGDDGIYNDPGVLVDDDGRVFVYYGFEGSNMNELDGETMYKVIPGSLRKRVMDDREEVPSPKRFYEASSPRKIGDTYYLIYSARKGCRLAYATSDAPTGPFTYRGYIIDNGIDYPGGNNHGSLCKVGDQWYIFYHRMTNDTMFSRRACVEKVTILPDGSIPPVEMTSLGFEESLNPYAPVKAEIACVLKGGCYITEKDVFTRVITQIKDGCVIGYKYFDFGEDASTKTMELAIKVHGCGCKGKLHVMIDGTEIDESACAAANLTPEDGRFAPDGSEIVEYSTEGARVLGKEIGVLEIGLGDGIYRTRVENVTGRHALYFKADIGLEKGTWTSSFFTNKVICEIEEFVFLK
ncbi:MAG: family 43 glycosylhydrolase [Lachnospiraceae bacterium]|nr:family 43 glycosylhydrolase [Lachnospiraceae bacterium]MBR3507628.1 family 43 glycosylhydrolase [Lachnospiraceae bacterium]MBR6150461.1 family 43 glycosylhydrolase [Lachnospiraceae bacterium]